MEYNKYILNEATVVKVAKEFIDTCDADVLASIIGKMYGGICFFVNDSYEFYPDENYMGAFDKEVQS